jgi:hypothetical protein
MTEQHSPDVHPFDESARAPNRWRVRPASAHITRGLPGGITLTRSLGAILAVLISWFCQHHGSVQGSFLVIMMNVLPRNQHHELTTCATYDEVVHRSRAMVPLSIPLPPPPVPPPPVPAVPHIAPVVPVVPAVPRVVPVVPHVVPVVPPSAPVVPYSVPVPPAPTWVFPRTVPVPSAPTRAFPPPVVVLEQVPNLVGDDLFTAEQVLIQHGLAIGSVSKQASNIPAGTVVQTVPKANTAVPAGTAINLVVAA